jgi:hypothetical protein
LGLSTWLEMTVCVSNVCTENDVVKEVSWVLFNRVLFEIRLDGGIYDTKERMT